MHFNLVTEKMLMFIDLYVPMLNWQGQSLQARSSFSSLKKVFYHGLDVELLFNTFLHLSNSNLYKSFYLYLGFYRVLLFICFLTLIFILFLNRFYRLFICHSCSRRLMFSRQFEQGTSKRFPPQMWREMQGFCRNLVSKLADFLIS